MKDDTVIGRITCSNVDSQGESMHTLSVSRENNNSDLISAGVTKDSSVKVVNSISCCNCAVPSPSDFLVSRSLSNSFGEVSAALTVSLSKLVASRSESNSSVLSTKLQTKKIFFSRVSPQSSSKSNKN